MPRNYDTSGTVWKVYAARDYNNKSPRMDEYIEVNLPEHTPTVPMDSGYTNISIGGGYFVNTNYPNTTGIIKSMHYYRLPLLRGTTCPIFFKKGTPFLLFTPTAKMEEGYLIYISNQ